MFVCSGLYIGWLFIVTDLSTGWWVRRRPASRRASRPSWRRPLPHATSRAAPASQPRRGSQGIHLRTRLIHFSPTTPMPTFINRVQKMRFLNSTVYIMLYFWNSTRNIVFVKNVFSLFFAHVEFWYFCFPNDIYVCFKWCHWQLRSSILRRRS